MGINDNTSADSLSLVQQGKLTDAIAAQAQLQQQFPERGDFFFVQAFIALCHRDDTALDHAVTQALALHCEPYFTQLFQALRCYLVHQYVQALNHANYDAAVQAMGGPDDFNTKVWCNQ